MLFTTWPVKPLLPSLNSRTTACPSPGLQRVKSTKEPLEVKVTNTERVVKPTDAAASPIELDILCCTLCTVKV